MTAILGRIGTRFRQLLAAAMPFEASGGLGRAAGIERPLEASESPAPRRPRPRPRAGSAQARPARAAHARDAPRAVRARPVRIRAAGAPFMLGSGGGHAVDPGRGGLGLGGLRGFGGPAAGRGGRWRGRRAAMAGGGRAPGQPVSRGATFPAARRAGVRRGSHGGLGAGRPRAGVRARGGLRGVAGGRGSRGGRRRACPRPRVSAPRLSLRLRPGSRVSRRGRGAEPARPRPAGMGPCPPRSRGRAASSGPGGEKVRGGAAGRALRPDRADGVRWISGAGRPARPEWARVRPGPQARAGWEGRCASRAPGLLAAPRGASPGSAASRGHSEGCCAAPGLVGGGAGGDGARSSGFGEGIAAPGTPARSETLGDPGKGSRGAPVAA